MQAAFAKTTERAPPAPAAATRTPWSYVIPAHRSSLRGALASTLGILPKLEVSRPHDPWEREADDIADRVVAMREPALPGGGAAPPAAPPPRSLLGQAARALPSLVQRLASGVLGDEVDADEHDRMVHTAGAPGVAPASAAALPDAMARRVLRLLRGGTPLPPSVRQFFEARFGLDFSSVRIHTGAEPAAVSSAMNARAFTVGDHIAFGRGGFQPQSAEGRRLIAHELAHVAQQRAAPAASGPTAATGAAPAAKPGRAATSGPDVQRDDDPSLLELAALALTDPYAAVRRVAPRLEPILRDGPLEYLKGQLGAAFDGLAARVTEALPPGAAENLNATFEPLVERATQIGSALASGDCEPLFTAIDDLKTFVSEVAGQAWDGLVDALRPIGDFFTDLWDSAGAPAVEWLTRFAGDLWSDITALGQEIWDWTQPLRDDVALAWDWLKEQLFGAAEEVGNDAGGVIDWITAKATEAWEWVKEQTRPVWEPVAQALETVRSLIPPAFIREMGEQFQDMGARLNAVNEAAGEGGDSVAENREAVAAALPSLQEILALVRGGIVSARAFVLSTMGTLAGQLTGFLGALRNNGLLSGLADTLAWLEGLANDLLAWAQQKVAALYDGVLAAFDFLSPFVERLLGVARQVIAVVGDVMQLPQLVLGAVWNLIPECIREPIKTFVIEQILQRIPVFSSLLALPDIWARVEAVALRILRQVFVDGDLLGGAWTFFSNMLELIGIPPQLIVSILAKAATAIGDILTDPIRFLETVLAGIVGGFKLFMDNIGTHLLNGISGWLFGALEGAGITMPADFSLQSILGLVMDILGISRDHVLDRLALQVGPEVVANIRAALDLATGVWEWVAVAINEGPGGLWRMLQDRLSDLWGIVLEGAMGWITERVIAQALIWIGGFVDISGIMPTINTCIAIYRAIESAVEYMVPILRIIDTGLDGIGAMARGDSGPAAAFVEIALDRALPVAIGFLAAQVGLGGISGRIREIIGDVRDLIDRGIDWLIEHALALGRSALDLFRRGAAAVRGGITSLADWWTDREHFETPSGEDHEVYFTGTGTSARLMVASGHPTPYTEFIAGVTPRPGGETAKTDAQDIAGRLDTAVHAWRGTPGGATGGVAPGAPGANPVPDNPTALITDLLHDLAVATARFMPDGAGTSTEPVYGPKVNGFGSSVRVERLTKNHRNGSRADSTLSTPIYDILDRRRQGGRAFYCRGHLLNQHLGGPGNNWDNLTPMFQTHNGRFNRDFEEPVKRAVAAGSAVRFVVTATYGLGVHPDRAATTDPRIQEVMDAERSVPKRIDYAATYVGPPAAGSPTTLPSGPLDTESEIQNYEYVLRP